MWWLAACAPVDPEAARLAWLEETFVRADAPWLARDPDLLAAKYARMSADPYDFLRGALPVFAADRRRLVGERSETAFLGAPAASAILLFGDAHPENLASVVTAGPRVGFEVVDLDAAAYGPWTFDLARAAQAVALFGGDGLDDAGRDAAVAALAAGYADELDRLAAGEAPSAPSGRLASAAVAEAAIEGPAREEHAARTLGGQLVTDAALDDTGAGTLRLDAEDTVRAARLFAALAAIRPGFRPLDVARRYGQGVASMPALRYVVLYDLGGDGDADDDLLQLRETVDPVPPPGIGDTAGFADQGDRIVSATAWLQATPDADPNLAALTDGAQTFKVRSASSWYVADVEHTAVQADLARGDLAAVDVADLAAFLGRRIADGHARAPTADGADALPVLLADLDGRVDLLCDELVAGARRDRETLLADFARFQVLLADRGPWLGAERLVEDVNAR